MIKDNQKYFNRLHLLMDAVVVAVSYLLAWYIKFCTIFADTEPGAGALDMETYFSFLYLEFITLLTLLIFNLYYKIRLPLLSSVNKRIWLCTTNSRFCCVTVA